MVRALQNDEPDGGRSLDLIRRPRRDRQAQRGRQPRSADPIQRARYPDFPDLQKRGTEGKDRGRANQTVFER